MDAAAEVGSAIWISLALVPFVRCSPYCHCGGVESEEDTCFIDRRARKLRIRSMKMSQRAAPSQILSRVETKDKTQFILSMGGTTEGAHRLGYSTMARDPARARQTALLYSQATREEP
jgi:hypothetical protein